jgi:hypothetical protein
MQTATVQPAAAGDANAEIQSLLGEIRTGWSGVSVLPAEVKTLRESNERLASDLKEVRRQLAARSTGFRPRLVGQVSEECARQVAASFVLHCERSDKLEALCSVPAQRDAMLTMARDTLGLSTRAALTTAL